MKKVIINDRIIDVNMREMKYSIDIFIIIDYLYNLIVYENCGIALSFEWIVIHLKENYDIKKKIVNIMRFLNMMRLSMRLNEADAWIKSMSAIKAIQNISVHPGFICDQCQYYTRDKKSMREHFSNKHKGLKALENSQEYMIQMSFKARL